MSTAVLRLIVVYALAESKFKKIIFNLIFIYILFACLFGFT